MCLFDEAYLDKKESDNSYHMIKKKEKKTDLTKEFIKKVINIINVEISTLKVDIYY